MDDAKERGHESDDPEVRSIAWFSGGLALVTAVIFVVVVGLYQLFEHWHPSPDAPSRIALHPRVLAPSPQLQTNPTIDLAEYEAAAKAKLDSYGWVDRQTGVARIPISRAMDLIVERGLPTRGPGTQDASGVTSVQMQERKANGTKP